MNTTKPKRSDFATQANYIQAWYKHKRATDPKYAKIASLYAQTWKLLHRDSYFSKALGCNGKTFREHIESQFWKVEAELGRPVTWDDYGTIFECNHKLSLVDAFKGGGLSAMDTAAHYLNIEPCLKKKNRAGKAGKEHTTHEKFLAKEDVNPIIQKTDDGTLIKLGGNNPKFTEIWIDNKLVKQLKTWRFQLIRNANIPTVVKHCTDESTSIFYLISKDYKPKRFKRISGAPNDFRSRCFEFKTDEEIAARRRKNRRDAVKRNWEKDREKRNERYRRYRANKRLKEQSK